MTIITKSGQPLLYEKESCILRGFTLIETLIYITIVGLVISSFIAFSISISNSRNKTYVVQEVQANARVALDLISQRMRASNGVNIGQSTFDSDPGELSLAMTDIVKNPTVINLDQDDGILQITEGTSDPIAIISDKVKITNLVFTNLNPGGEKENIRIEITTEYNNSGDIEYSYSQNWQTAVSIRQ